MSLEDEGCLTNGLGSVARPMWYSCNIRALNEPAPQPVKKTTNMVHVSVVFAAALIALWALATPVHAYLDPGTGNMLLQGIIGGAAVAAGVVAHFWRRLRALIPWRRDSSAAPAAPEE